LVVPPQRESVRSGPLPQYEQEVTTQVAGLLNPLNPPPGQKIKRVIAELEKRRAELFTIALDATARAQEAEKKRAEAEAIARAAIEKVHKMEALFLGRDAGANEDAERRLVFGLLVFANGKGKRRARKAAKRRVTAEATLKTGRQPAFLEYEVRGKGLGGKIKFVGYGLTIALLLIGICWLLIEAFFQS
jgi:hypothetical protein